MLDLKIGSTAFKVGVVSISIIGVMILSLLAYLDQDEQVLLENLDGAIGKDVTTHGLIVGVDSAADGSTMLLLSDGNCTAEVLIEKGAKGLEVGSSIRLKGEVRSYGNGFILEVPSKRSLEVIEGAEAHDDSGPWTENTIGTLQGMVETAYWTGPGSSETVIRANSSDALKGPLRTVLICRRVDHLPGAGDLVLAQGLRKSEGNVLCYGDSSLKVLFKAVPRTADLISLVEQISRSPTDAPIGPFTIMGYLRSEPGTSRYLTVGESPDGGRLNIRVRIPEGTVPVHRGDLVELRNCTLFWDTDQMRYALEPREMVLLGPYGPWKLDLGSVGDQLRYYIGTPVSISGTICIIDGTAFLKDDGSELLLINHTAEMVEGASGTLIGPLGFDGLTTRLFMDVGKGEWVT
ncbi:MAG: hypothetical protein MUC62_06585 [Candidatus Thermoplasmatota archaeon]|jgi:hypothetical protein|nr:hypothetical protein [Candidatus Thermoplasmatota archaeon]